MVFSSQVAEWTDEDYAALAKAMAKFPGGTPGRWERIAHELGRRADEVSRIIVRGISGAQHSSKTERVACKSLHFRCLWGSWLQVKLSKFQVIFV